mmetsp:Transcript_23159/g.34296  ORF Transcript_23159/g.34296 Transcript_23159/m.34296 type:complete len:99 (-) Transcript_23159:100-396(-)
MKASSYTLPRPCPVRPLPYPISGFRELPLAAAEPKGTTRTKPRRHLRTHIMNTTLTKNLHLKTHHDDQTEALHTDLEGISESDGKRYRERSADGMKIK